MSRPPRVALEDYVGIRQHFATICTYRRRQVFQDADEVFETRLHSLQQASDDAVEISAYCFMPDHVRLLLTGVQQTSDVYRCLRLAKQRAGDAFSRRRGERLWQEGFFDRVLRSDETTAGVIRYIINNPVRAGLASGPEEYPHWGSSRWSREEILEFVRTACRP